MLTELVVRDLGVIEEVHLLLGPGLTAVTGETGAGKTLLVEAIDLLVGGRADATLVRAGAAEGVVEGRFVLGGEEVVLRRVVPSDGRSRAYVNGRMATVADLAEQGRSLVDLHGQHSHQSLLSGLTQRAALDHFAGTDLASLTEARQQLRDIDAAIGALGGDSRSRAREVDLLRYQVDELVAADLQDPDEDERLESEEDALADVVAHRDAALLALDALGDEGARDALSVAASGLAGRAPFGSVHERLVALGVELDDIAAELRAALEVLEEDPARLEEVRARRQLLHELRRKYGDTLADVMAYHGEAEARLTDLASHDQRLAELEAQRVQALAAETAAARAVGRVRRAGAPELGRAVQSHLTDLAMGRAQVEVTVSDDPEGRDVAFLLAANPGEPPLPLSKVASGGELARAMLALRLVLTEAPETLLFDEVDAGIGGQAALAVGRALAGLGQRHQVLVVTHLAQVAAFAERQIAVDKQVTRDRTRAVAREVAGEARVVELARMLSGMSESGSARLHAVELLDGARAVTGS
jgi:DNA repair protein RecN (Recombination protein N)